MRHGPAEDRSTSGLDADRALTADGRERVRRVADLLQASDEAPLLVVSSPLVRALQTAELVASQTRVDARGGAVEVRRELAPGGRASDLVDELYAAGRRRVMVVGHEPDVTTLVERLASRPRPTGFRKAQVVGLSLGPSGEPGATSYLVRPRFELDPKSFLITRA